MFPIRHPFLANINMGTFSLKLGVIYCPVTHLTNKLHIWIRPLLSAYIILLTSTLVKSSCPEMHSLAVRELVVLVLRARAAEFAFDERAVYPVCTYGICACYTFIQSQYSNPVYPDDEHI